jgi:hypothetical protein
VIASGIHSVAYYGRDAAGNVADGGISNGRPSHAPATATLKIDREPPRVAFAGAQDPLEPERIEARASDSLSGGARSASGHPARASASSSCPPSAPAFCCAPAGTRRPTRPASTNSAPPSTTWPGTRLPARARATARRCASPAR